MNASGQLYTVGLWSVKPGSEAAFVAAWREFADWTVKHQPGALEGHLLQDIDESSRFVSFGPWKDAQSIQAWRERPEFQTFLAKVRELCEVVQPGTLRSVVYVVAPAAG